MNPVNTGAGRTTTDLPAVSISFSSEGLPVLDALKIIIRSLHNCRVFGYYGGIQKLTALMKGMINIIDCFYIVICIADSFCLWSTNSEIQCFIYSYI